MPKITFIEHDGGKHEIESVADRTTMHIATENAITAIVGDCGGNMTCATCHVYVDEAWLDRVPPASDDEVAMLECVLDPQPNSRLSCQIKFDDSLDGLVLHLPASQF
ncbi:MAG: 2Fe-2S iron-sulfur cluster-binding protein [Pseudoxanthomonas sp.]